MVEIRIGKEQKMHNINHKIETRKTIVFIDSGDTLINEATQVYNSQEIVERADFIEGAKELLVAMKAEGFRVCLVADGEWESFLNVYRENGMRSFFEGWIVSEVVGVQKPEQAMFQAAMVAMNLTDEDRSNIVMVGNNLKKDIAGANRFGLTSIWLDWSPRYFHEVEQTDWQPDYTIRKPIELMEVLRALESEDTEMLDTYRK